MKIVITVRYLMHTRLLVAFLFGHSESLHGGLPLSKCYIFSDHALHSIYKGNWFPSHEEIYSKLNGLSDFPASLSNENCVVGTASKVLDDEQT